METKKELLSALDLCMRQLWPLLCSQIQMDHLQNNNILLITSIKLGFKLQNSKWKPHLQNVTNFHCGLYSQLLRHLSAWPITRRALGSTIYKCYTLLNLITWPRTQLSMVKHRCPCSDFSWGERTTVHRLLSIFP